MAKIKVSEAATAKWIRGAEMATPEIEATLNEGEANSLINIHVEGDDETPQLFEVKLPPGTPQRVHAHEHDEIIYVVGGTMRIGARSLAAGSSIYIAGRTFYTFEAGPEGLHFLNFRPCKDISYILPDTAKETA